MFFILNCFIFLNIFFLISIKNFFPYKNVKIISPQKHPETAKRPTLALRKKPMQPLGKYTMPSDTGRRGENVDFVSSSPLFLAKGRKKKSCRTILIRFDRTQLFTFNRFSIFRESSLGKSAFLFQHAQLLANLDEGSNALVELLAVVSC